MGHYQSDLRPQGYFLDGTGPRRYPAINPDDPITKCLHRAVYDSLVFADLGPEEVCGEIEKELSGFAAQLRNEVRRAESLLSTFQKLVKPALERNLPVS